MSQTTANGLENRPVPAPTEHLVETAFGYPRNFLGNRFVYVVVSPRARGLSIRGCPEGQGEGMKTYRLLVRPEAEADLAGAYRWYEEKSDGLGAEFLRSVEASLISLRKNPESYQKIHKNIRRALIRRFPYGVFYVVEQSTVVVLAVFHVRRDPKLLRTVKR